MDAYSMTFAKNGKPRIHFQPMTIVPAITPRLIGDNCRTFTVWTEHKPYPEARFALGTGVRFYLN